MLTQTIYFLNEDATYEGNYKARYYNKAIEITDEKGEKVLILDLLKVGKAKADEILKPFNMQLDPDEELKPFIRSTSKKAKRLIREHIIDSFNEETTGEKLEALKNLIEYKILIDREINTPYQALQKAVNDGNFNIGYLEMKKDLGEMNLKIPESNDKVYNYYKNLVAREGEQIYQMLFKKGKSLTEVLYIY